MRKILIENSEGQKLSARLDLPSATEPLACVIFAHCFTCSKNLSAVTNISRALNAEGFAVLRFDFTGLGESEGDFSDTNFSTNISDLEAAAAWLAREYEAPKLLIGHSLGGAAVLFAGARIDSVQAIATIGAPSSPDHVTHLFDDEIHKIESNDEAKVDIGGRPFKIKKQFLEDISATNMQRVVKELRKPILLLHSPQDNTVGIKNAAEIYGYAMHPKSFISLDGADHLLSSKQDSQYAGQVIASWAMRYLELSDAGIKPLENQVAVSLADGFLTDVVAGKHHLVADEPESVGGTNMGPTPYDLLLASLGACTAMTMKMYAQRKRWQVDSVRVLLTHEKKHAEDCIECEKSSSKIDYIGREIKINGNLDEAQLERMMEIADKCPVHKTLHSQIQVQTSLIE